MFAHSKFVNSYSAPMPRTPARHSLVAILLCGAVIAAVTLGASEGSARARSRPSNEDRFTAVMLEKFRQAMPNTAIRAEAPLTLSVGSGKQTHTLNLGNIYRVCVSSPDLCDEEISSFVSRMTTFYTTPEPPLDRASLRVVIRPQAYVDQMREVMAAQGGPIVIPLAGGFWVVGVFDLPTAIRMANLRDLDQLGISADEALSVAKQNMLAEMHAQIDSALASRRNGVMVLGGDYATSLFGFPELWAPLAATLHGDLVAALPASDVLLFGDAAIPDMTAKLGEVARKAMAGARRPFSDTVFRWSPNGWTPLPQT